MENLSDQRCLVAYAEGKTPKRAYLKAVDTYEWMRKLTKRYLIINHHVLNAETRYVTESQIVEDLDHLRTLKRRPGTALCVGLSETSYLFFLPF